MKKWGRGLRIALALFAIFLISGALTSISRADSVTLYILEPAIENFNWSSPRNLMVSVLKSKLLSSFGKRLSPTFIGHAIIRLDCSQEPIPHPLWTSQTWLDNQKSMTNFLEDSPKDLSVLFKVFDGGKMEPLQWMASRLKQEAGTDHFRSWKVLVSPAACHRMAQFYESFIQDKDYEKYAITARPRYHEGSNCISYAATFFDVSGAMSAEIEHNWTRTLSVPRLYLKPSKKAYESLAFDSHWARPGEPSITVQVWDPTSIYRWIGQQWYQARMHLNPINRPAWNFKSLQLVTDDTQAPVPTDPVFLAP